jgi:gliding motility-associated-like protein
MNYLRQIALLLLLLLTGSYSYAQLSAGFTMTPTSGCSPLVVNFTNTSSGATSYAWTFGNNATSAQLNTQTSYTNPGTYTVTLVASNGSNSSTYTQTVTVYPPPTVVFTSTDTLVCTGVSVSFQNTSVLNTAGAGTYNWDFGDGSTSNQQNPSHVFPGPGYYSITLTVTNSQGCSSTLVHNALIHVLPLPVPVFSTNDTFFCRPPAIVNFSNNSSGAGPLSYTWHFGDGNTQTGNITSHTYNTTGSFSPMLIVTDVHGCKDSITHTNLITIDNFHAQISAPDTACLQSVVTLVASPATAVFYFWDFGDGATDYAQTTYHVYPGSGVYHITLIMYDGNCYDTAHKDIFIRPLPTVSFTWNPNKPCPLPSTVNFTPTAPAGSSYYWSFGDGGNATSANPTHTFQLNTGFLYFSNGSWDTVTLTVTDPHGCVATVIDTVKINDLELITMPPDTAGFSGCVPRTCHFKMPKLYTNIPYFGPGQLPFLSNDTPLTNIVWHFGDGSPNSSVLNPVHQYNNPGRYAAYVSCLSAKGCYLVDTFLVIVGHKPVITSYTVTPGHLCLGDTVTCIGHATGDSPLVYQYNFNSQFSSASTFLTPPQVDTIFKIKVTIPNVYTAFLVVTSSGCNSDTSTKYIVKVDSPYAGFKCKPSCDTPTAMLFIDTSQGETSHIWLFGDGTTANDSMLWHVYPHLGSWDCFLATYDSLTGCRDTVDVPFHQFHIGPNWPDTAICRYTTWDIQPTLFTGPLFPSVLWYYVNNNLEESICNCPCMCPVMPPIRTDFNFYYGDTGHYTVKLVFQDSLGCKDSVLRTVWVDKPNDSFTALPTVGCIPMPVNFTDHSHFMNGATFSSANWDFGDGYNANVNTPATNHTYGIQGYFTVTEIVTDNIGCKDTLTHLNLINGDKAHAIYTASNNYPCIGDSVFFQNFSNNNIVSSYWQFGDGDTSTANTPTHAYLDTGSYTVTLIVTNVNGCKDTLSQTAFIQVTKPIAAFTMNDSTGVCIPLVIHFTNTTVGGTTYNWSFGNGNGSPAMSPTNSYTVPGIDTITLIATNAHGCSDTTYRHATLYGYAGSLSYLPLQGCPPLVVNFTASVLNVPYLRYDFSDGNVSAVTTLTQINHSYVSPGAYVPKLIMSDSSGCQVSSTGLDTIKVDSVAAYFKYAPRFICLYDTVQFTDSSYSMFSVVNHWLWLFDDGSSSNIATPQHAYDSVGNAFPVTLVITDGFGCHDTLRKQVQVYPLPVLSTGGDTTICAGDHAPIWAMGAISYTWTPANSLSCSFCQYPIASPGQTTLYFVKGTDARGCNNTDTVRIKTKTHIKTYVGPGAAICYGESVQLSDSGALSYTWFPSTGLSNGNVSHPLATPYANTTYMAIGQTASCTPDTNYVSITIYPLPSVNAGSDKTILDGASAQIEATGSGVQTFSWSPAEGLSCLACSDPLASPHYTTQYTVTVTSRYGCQDSGKVTIHVLCDNSQVFVPNSFTPNGDGQNDVFYPRGVGLKEIASFRIYDRWGEMLFEKTHIQLNDEANAWDGTYKGNRPRPDVYVYVITGVCETGEQMVWKGDVTILK